MDRRSGAPPGPSDARCDGASDDARHAAGAAAERAGHQLALNLQSELLQIELEKKALKLTRRERARLSAAARRLENEEALFAR